MRNSYKVLYEKIKETDVQKDKEIFNLQEQLDKTKKEYAEQKTKDDNKINELETEKTKLISEKDDLSSVLEDTEEKLRVMELSRFASSYEKQELDYEKQQRFWFRIGVVTTGLLILSVLLSILGPKWFNLSVLWYKEPGFYLLNFIFLTLFIYALKQHSHLGNLRVDYANRKTLAQSYQHIVEDEGHNDIKEGFLKNASEIFSSKAMMRSDDVTLYEALVAKLLGPKQDK